MIFVYYIDFDDGIQQKFFYKLYSKFFIKCKEIEIDENKRALLLNRAKIDKRAVEKIYKFIPILKSKIVLSKSINQVFKFDKNLYFDGKLILKNMLIKLLEYIENIVACDFRKEYIHVAMDNDQNMEYIYGLGYMFKNINIVTQKIRKLDRLDKKLQKDDNLIFSISNNKKKSLKDAKIIVNFDYDNTFFDRYCINRNCIIINLSSNSLIMKNSFHGVVIEGIGIKYEKRDVDTLINKEKYDDTTIYESYMCNMDYNSIQSMINEDKCYIKAVFGQEREISDKELKNNYTKSSIKLDKIKKKD